MDAKYYAKCAAAACWDDCQPPEGLEVIEKISEPSTDTQVYIGVNQSTAVVVFRGSTSKKDWETDAECLQTTFSGGMKVHSGFHIAYESVSNNVSRALKGNCSKFDNVVTVGHSLGGALATLAAYDIKLRTPAWPMASYTFGSPRVGNGAFVKAYNDAIPNTTRVVNAGDIVPMVPLLIMGYRHVSGEKKIGNWFPFEGWIDFFLKKYNHDASTIANHDIQEYIAKL